MGALWHYKSNAIAIAFGNRSQRANRITPRSKTTLQFSEQTTSQFSGQIIHFLGQQESVVAIFVRGTIPFDVNEGQKCEL